MLTSFLKPPHLASPPLIPPLPFSSLSYKNWDHLEDYWKSLALKVRVLSGANHTTVSVATGTLSRLPWRLTALGLAFRMGQCISCPNRPLSPGRHRLLDSSCFWKGKVLRLVLEATFVAAKVALDHSLAQVVSSRRPPAVHPQLWPKIAEKERVRGCMLVWINFQSRSFVFWNSSGNKPMKHSLWAQSNLLDMSAICKLN